MYVANIDDEGVFSFVAPLDSLNSATKLSVVGIRNFADIEADGVSVFTIIYELLGLTSVEYEYGLNNNIKIITLKKPNGDVIHIPSNYIDVAPDNTGLEYVELTLVSTLGVLPKGIDTTNLTNAISGTIYDTIGVSTDAITIESSGVIMIPKLEADAFEATRVAIPTADRSLTLINKELKLENARQANLITLLEAELVRLTP